MRVHRFEQKDKMRVLKEENKKMQKVAVGVEAEKKRLEAIIYGPKP